MNGAASVQGEIDALNSEITLEEEIYATLLGQYEEAWVAEAIRAGGITVVEPAIEPELSPTYLVSATLRIAQAQIASIEDLGYAYAERLMNTYVEIARSRPILEEVIQRIELSMTPEDLAKEIKAEALASTELIRISVEDSNPQRARDIANALVTVLIEQSQSLYSGGAKSAREILQEQLKVIEGDLEQDRASLESLMSGAASAQGEIDALNSKITLEEETYATLLGQYEEARVAEAMRASGITVVEPATEPQVSPTYSASATLRVAQAQSASLEGLDYVYAERLMNTYVKIVRSRPILEEVIQRLELSKTPEDLATKIEAEALANTELIRINVEDGSPQRARDIANALATVLIEQSQSLYSGGAKSAREVLQERIKVIEGDLEQDRASLQSLVNGAASVQGEIDALNSEIGLEEEIYATLLGQYEEARVAEAIRASSIAVVESAIEPEWPSKPRKRLNIMLGALVGLVGGMGLAFLLENLDTTLYTMEQVSDVSRLPILGKIPEFGGQGGIAIYNSGIQIPVLGKIPVPKIHRFGSQRGAAIYTSGDSLQAEAYRLLRTNILSLGYDTPLKTLQITSAERKEGKTTVVANLARAMAQAGRKVIAVDGNLRVPALHHVFELPNEVGLSSILEQRASLEEASQNTRIPRLQVLTSGPLPPNPAELLGAPEMVALLDQLVQEFDIVLIDSSSLLAVADAVVLASLVDGVMVVIGLAQVTQGAARVALKQLADVKAKPLGVIVNRAGQSGEYYAKERPEVEMPKTRPIDQGGVVVNRAEQSGQYHARRHPEVAMSKTRLIGSELRELRLRQDLSLQALADKAGISRTTVWRLEKGSTRHPSINTQIAIGAALGLSPTEIDFVS